MTKNEAAEMMFGGRLDSLIEIGTTVTDIRINRISGRMASGEEDADAITKS